MKTPLTSIQAKQNARQRKSGYTLMIVLGAMAVMGMVSAGFLYTAAQDLRTFNNWRD